MRLFTGIALPDTLLQNLDKLVQTLRPTAKIAWSPVANLHLTTKFIGQWQPEKLPDLQAILQPLTNRHPFTLYTGGLDFLPDARRPRVLFVDVKPHPELYQLARDTEQALLPAGIAPEDRPYKPHLTLARLRPPVPPLTPLRDAIGRLADIPLGEIFVQSFHLYLSKPSPGGSIYSSLAEYRFAQTTSPAP